MSENISRRNITKTAAWTTPILASTLATPAFASSPASYTIDTGNGVAWDAHMGGDQTTCFKITPSTSPAPADSSVTFNYSGDTRMSLKLGTGQSNPVTITSATSSVCIDVNYNGSGSRGGTGTVTATVALGSVSNTAATEILSM